MHTTIYYIWNLNRRPNNFKDKPLKSDHRDGQTTILKRKFNLSNDLKWDMGPPLKPASHCPDLDAKWTHEDKNFNFVR